MHDAEFRERVNSKVTYDSSDSGGPGKWKNSTFLNKNSSALVTTDTQNLSPDEIRVRKGKSDFFSSFSLPPLFLSSSFFFFPFL